MQQLGLTVTQIERLIQRHPAWLVGLALCLWHSMMSMHDDQPKVSDAC